MDDIFAKLNEVLDKLKEFIAKILGVIENIGNAVE